MREDLIKQVTSLNNINHVVVLTHNIDFVFLQTVFLSSLKKCGHPSLTVFADAQCAHESYRFQSAMITGLGKRFRVIPVTMNPGYRFHPKAVFLVGDDQASLFVGSGNMTFGGMRENAEIWHKFSTKDENYSEISAFRDYLNDLSNRVAFKESVDDYFRELFDGEKHEWATQLGEPEGIIGRVNESDSLESKILDILGSGKVSKIVVSTPYFDPKADALKKISSHYPNSPVDLLIQSGQSTLFSEAAKKLPSNIKLKSIAFTDPKKDGESQRRFIHAKYYAFFIGEEVHVFAGSANCSRAALLKSGSEGNAELMVSRRLGVDEFNAEFVDEFNVSDSAPELITERLDEDEEKFDPAIHLLAARYDVNLLKIAFRCSKDVKISGCLIDGTKVDFEVRHENEAWAHVSSAPKSVVLNGISQGNEVVSNKIWVDQESSLRSSSKGRALLDRIRNSDTENDMQAEEWTLIVELFAKDLDYTTAKELHRQQSQQDENQSDDDPVYSRSDVFSESYDKAPSFASHDLHSLSGKNVNIYSLLLNAFGIDTKSTEENVENDEDDEDTVDSPEKIKKQVKDKKAVAKLSARVQRKITKVIDAIIGSFTDESYLKYREPDRLGTDLQIAGLVLRKALSEKWIDDQQFFDATQKIWSVLFFSSSKNSPIGWLSVRYRQAKDKENFIHAMRSPQLAATLFAWSLAVDITHGGPYVLRFWSSLLLSMGRFPWLWHVGIDQDELFDHLYRILRESPCKYDNQLAPRPLHKQRISLLRQGVALAEMEYALASENISELRDKISDKSVSRGEILWQGKRGICVALQATNEARDKVKVLSLQDPEGETAFMKNFLMPIRQLNRQGILLNTERFDTPQRNEIRKLIDFLMSIQSSNRTIS